MGDVTGEAKVERLGAERAPVVIVDGFVSDPEGLADYAARCTYRPVADNLYPGVRAPAPRAYAERVVHDLADLVRGVFGMGGMEIARVECDFSLVTTTPSGLKLLQSMPHFDTTNPHQVAILHYLCPPERGGTSFYRHRGTGFESITEERHDAYMARLGAELKTTGPPEQGYIAGDTALFERIGSVAAAFNRLAIYRSVVLHSGDIARDFGFEQDVRRGRLTVNTFIQFRPGRSIA